MEIDPRAGGLPGTSGEARPRIGHVRGYLLDLVCLAGHSRRATDHSLPEPATMLTVICPEQIGVLEPGNAEGPAKPRSTA